MSIPEITQTLLDAKKEKGLSFADLEKILFRDEVYIASVFYRQASASEQDHTCNWSTCCNHKQV